MKKFMNDVEDIVRDSLGEFALAHADLVSVHLHPTFVTRRHQPSPKVVLVSGGGVEHEPLHVGFVGKGMLDAACPGQVFTSLTPDQLIAATPERPKRLGGSSSWSRTTQVTP